MSLARSSATVGSLTLASRVLGFVRDMLVSNYMGASLFSDAFFVAFKLPNFLRRLFAEGAFNAGFLPMYAGMVKVDGPDAARDFASEAGSFLMWLLLLLSGLGIAFMPHLMFFLAPGFESDPVKLALTVSLTRITFPYILFISLVSLLGGVLNSGGRFAAVAATPIWMNISMIAGLWIFRPFFEGNARDAYAFAWGVMLAGGVQFAWLLWACVRAGNLPRLLRRPRWTPRLKRLLILIAPAALGAGVAQINMLVDLWLASKLPGAAVSFIYYADRLYELPLGVIGIAVSTALLPMLAKEIKGGGIERARAHLNQAIQLVMLFGLPSAVAYLVIARSIIHVIFERGHFSAQDTANVTPTLIAFSIGLPAFLLAKIFASCFYAAQDTKSPVRIAILCVVVNFIGNIILMQYIAHVGLALSTAISGWLNAVLLGIGLWKRGAFAPNWELFAYMAKNIAACLVMAGVLFAAQLPLVPLIDASSLLPRILGLMLLIGAGGISYFAVMFATGAVDPRKVKAMLRPRSAIAAAPSPVNETSE